MPSNAFFSFSGPECSKISRGRGFALDPLKSLQHSPEHLATFGPSKETGKERK